MNILYDEENIDFDETQISSLEISSVKQCPKSEEIDVNYTEEVVPSILAERWKDWFRGNDLRPRPRGSVLLAGQR